MCFEYKQCTKSTEKLVVKLLQETIKNEDRESLQEKTNIESAKRNRISKDRGLSLM
mgnify:CR=1 FL=1